MVNNNLIEALEMLLGRTTEQSKKYTSDFLKDYNAGLINGLKLAINMAKEVV